ncbi:MAG: hypothetical protein ACREOO_18685, partial [bacterium]
EHWQNVCPQFLLHPFRVLDGNVHLPRVRCALPSALMFNAFGVEEEKRLKLGTIRCNPQS